MRSLLPALRTNAIIVALWLALGGVIILRAQAEANVPEHNAATLTAAPPRPPAGDADEKAQRLFAAIVADDPGRATDFFFPREAFLRVKAMQDPGTYHDRLKQRFHQDIHALHRSLKLSPNAQFVRLELVKRGGWVMVGEEGNRLPYWVSRHSFIHYRDAGVDKRFEVRVLITWDDHWYITHLNEFH